ncbi:MAG TPA: hypothetical protein VFN29_01610 [Chiayiivirga sp.]|nr:hypothetical protein [Chiayiivirga sp.]
MACVRIAAGVFVPRLIAKGQQSLALAQVPQIRIHRRVSAGTVFSIDPATEPENRTTRRFGLGKLRWPPAPNQEDALSGRTTLALRRHLDFVGDWSKLAR